MGLISRVSSRTYRYHILQHPTLNMAEENWAEAAPQEAQQDWADQDAELAVEEDLNEPKLFGKWDLSEVQCKDMALADYIKFNAFMQKGRNNGKKMLSMRIVKHAFEIIHVMTGENPVQICVSAIMNGGPREDSTRIGRAGSVRRQACDVSPMRRVNQAIWLITTGAKNAAFRNMKTIAECLADDLMNAAKGSSNSFAIKKKDELERVAKSNR